MKNIAKNVALYLAIAGIAMLVAAGVLQVWFWSVSSGSDSGWLERGLFFSLAGRASCLCAGAIWLGAKAVNGLMGWVGRRGVGLVSHFY